MRVITGTAGGLKLNTLDGLDVRPTTEKVKEAIFSSIQFDIEGRCFLDLFAGSGQMGIEALSRGAAKAVFVDMSRNSIRVTEENLRKTKLSQYAVTFNRSAESFLASNYLKFDIAFLDPPYNKQIIQSVLPILEPFINDGGTVICETSQEDKLPNNVGKLVLYREYNYSKTHITVYRKQSAV